jgi:hypothetical protein
MHVTSCLEKLIRVLELMDDEQKKIEFIKGELNSLEDHRYRETIEISILQYLENGNLGELKRPKTLCVSLHGIRTHGKWGYHLKELLQTEYDINTSILSFGFKDVLSFIFPYLFKSISIKYIEDQLKMLLSKNDNVILVLVAHSFGTYIMSKIIERNPNIKFDRVIYCGSVVPEKFPWEKKFNFPKGGFINDCGINDIWPVIAKAFGTNYGDSGRSGFTSFEVQDRFHECDHGGFFATDFMKKFWLPFIADGQVVQSDIVEDKPWFLSVITLFQGQLFWMIIISIIFYFLHKYFF